MKRVFAWTVVLLLASHGLAGAQETTTGTIAGLVMDSTGAVLPGVSVTVVGVQGTRTYATDSTGRFLAPFLTPGRYTVRLELQGFRSVEQPDVIVPLGQRVALEFTMQVGAVTEAVQVTASSPVVDVQATTIGGVLDSDVLKHLPVGRNFMASAYLVPGVSSSGQVGAMNPSIAGGSGLENNYIVDGVNITNTGYGGIGSYSIVFGSLGNGVTTDFIQETQVKTAGFEAEYGMSTGGVVNVVTKSGSNAFHGSAYGFTRPGATEADWEQIQTPNGTINTTERAFNDAGATLGGRLIEDRAFFFGAFNPQWQTRNFIAPEDFPLEGTEQQRERRLITYAGKVTWQAAAQHRIDVSLFGDPSEGLRGLQRASGLLTNNLAPRISKIKYGAHNQVVKYDGIPRNNWLFEASFARSEENFEETPDLQEWSVRDTTVVPNVFTGGFGFYDEGTDGLNMQYSAKSTHLFDTANAGSHQIRYGFLYEDINYDHTINRTGPSFTLPNGQQTVTGATIFVVSAPQLPGGKMWRVVRGNTSNVRATTQQYVSFFAQDTWQVNRLTIRPGVRYEQQDLVGDEAVPLCREGESRPGVADGTGAPKACSFQWTGNWGPRVGVTYDVMGNGRSKLYGNWGRFFAKVPNDLAVRAMSADSGVTRADYFDAGLTRPIPNGVLAGAGASATTTHFLQAGLHAAIIDPESKSTYLDEFLAGFEFEVAPAVALDFRYVRRDMPRVLEDVGTTPLVAYFLDLPGLESVEYFITNPTPATPLTITTLGAAFEDPVHTYDAFEVVLNRRLRGNWSAVASYRFSRLEGTFEGFFRNDNGQSDPAITSLYDFPTNDPSFAQFAPVFGFRGDIRLQGDLGAGPLPNDRPHQIKLFGNYIWNDVNFGIGFDAGSGAPLTALASNPAYNNSGEIPEGPRGSGIDTIDGFQERTPFITTVDFHVDYSIPVNGRSLVLVLDAFNLFNNQDPTMYDYATETNFAVINPNGPLGTAGAQPLSANVSSFPSFIAPFSLQFGARFEW